ncbi:SDR family NAD(P)-dependent oxidoreductase [Nostoc sp. CMAA1605]|uniref:SDR family NAD(P)-dependent oxidoreductase n=1 Tax=Nostoc sp. CMAA1605 TaxID=2055159 RepID=UPI001F3C9EC9|nr:SDR family oxidoreductase [Nostoc sp. CMAA1605]MCF4967539.1 short-chain dehydrogenase [Nostoc sp. CMAA1605]
MKKSHQRNQTVLITGAANGIGYELAYIFAQNNYNLVLVDIMPQKLADVADKIRHQFEIRVKPIVKDLSINTSPEDIFAELQQESIQIDVLVNNAGFGIHGLFSETNLNTELEMLQVNLVTLTHLTKLFLKDMVRKGDGKILNLASAAAFQPGPLMAVYFATKAYILSFSQALARELENTGVTVTALCPGPTESAFHKRTGLAGARQIESNNMMDAKKVAKIGYRALMAGKTVAIPGLKNKMLAEMVRFIPRNLVTKIVKNMQEVT